MKMARLAALAAVAVVGLVLATPAHAQTATFSNLVDAAPGSSWNPDTTAVDPQNPNRLVFGFHSSISPTSWTSLGSIYLSLLQQVDPAATTAELGRMRELIERDGTLWEVLDSRGRPWHSASRLSISDASMLWGAILLDLLEEDARR